MSPALRPAVVAVLLAAGEGRRFGALKQVAPIGGEPMVRGVARTLLGRDLPLLVVTGAGSDRVAAALAGLPLACVPNPAWADGLGASLGCGIRAVRERFPGGTAALVCLADHPLLDADALQAMLDRHARVPERILAADHDGVAGPPVLFPADCLAPLDAWRGPEGAQAWLRQQGERVERLPFDVTDVDTRADLIHVQQQWVEQPGEPARAFPQHGP